MGDRPHGRRLQDQVPHLRESGHAHARRTAAPRQAGDGGRNVNRPLLDGQPRRRSALTVALGILLALACLFLLANVLLTTFTYAVAVDGTSMENTVRDGDVVYALRSFTARRGDVVIIDVKDDPAFHEGGRKTDTIPDRRRRGRSKVRGRRRLHQTGRRRMGSAQRRIYQRQNARF